MTLDGRMRQAAESVRRYAEVEVDPAAMLWRLRAHERRRSLQAAAVALALVAGLVAAAVLVARAPRQPEVITPAPRSLGRVAATISLPQAVFPRAVGVADGVVWVDGGNATAVRVDPKTNQVLGEVRLPAGLRLAAVGPGSLWLVDEAAGTVSQADLTGHLRRTVSVGWQWTARNPAEEGFRLAVDGGSVWVAVQHTGVAHIDWTRGKVTSRFTRPPGAGYYDLIAAGGGAALTHGEEDADLLDPRTGKATAIRLGGLPTGAAFAAGSFWASVDNATLARIDPTSRRVVATVHLDAKFPPGPVVVGDGAVWVYGGGGLLQRIDPATNRVVHTLPGIGSAQLGTAYGRLAAGAGAVWLSDAENHTLLRIDPNG
jgi:streptogramin lyase